MKKSRLETALFKKVRIKIMRRKRGKFRVVIPAPLRGRGSTEDVVQNFPRKKEALVWLFTILRCIEPITIRVEEVK